MGKRKSQELRRATDRTTVKGHFLRLLDVVKWVKNNPWVFGVLIFTYSSIASGVFYIATKALRPVVRPMIDKRWQTKVAPYDSMAINFHKRLIILEESVFPEATE